MRYILWLPALLLMLTNGSNAPLSQGRASRAPQQKCGLAGAEYEAGYSPGTDAPVCPVV
jgi:hypothetical protein